VIPPPGAHGGDGVAIAAALGLDPASILDLSMSLNPFAPEVAAIVGRHLDAVSRYPDSSQTTAALAEALEVASDRVVLTNGGSEAIALVAATRGGTVVEEPEFALHPRNGSGPRWRSNPHNPSGALAPGTQRVDVWDEAFYPLATGHWTRGDEDTVVVGSLTKVFSCPGLRLGYVLAADARQITATQPAWPVNGLALAALPDLLAASDLVGWRDRIASQRDDLVALLGEHGLVADAADAPWVLTEAPGLRERLAVGGVVVRSCASFGLPDHARIAVPDDDGLARLEEVLRCTAP
jgi:histidinol-phosphate/aromatic aminotransferase/cobyric acid decarboxylase-like protein